MKLPPARNKKIQTAKNKPQFGGEVWNKSTKCSRIDLVLENISSSVAKQCATI